MKKTFKRIAAACFILLILHLSAEIVFVATGCSYPTSQDSFANKGTGDFLTVADVNKISCAVEQAQARINQIFAGKAGGQTIVGDTAASGSLGLTSTAHATKGSIAFGTQSLYNEASTLLGIGTPSPTFTFHGFRATPELMNLTTNSTGAIGPTIEIYHNTSSPAVSDVFAYFKFLANDSGGTGRQAAAIQMSWLDPTSTTMDTAMNFSVMNNVNASNTNMTATLTSLGVWTDGSLAKYKQYEGDIAPGVLAKFKSLKTLGVYHGAGTPQHKLAKAERHYSPTAEEFWQVFKLGKENSGGIAPKDVGWLAVKAIMELEARVAELEAKRVAAK